MRAAINETFESKTITTTKTSMKIDENISR
jgi:hypothetical protein